MIKRVHVFLLSLIFCCCTQDGNKTPSSNGSTIHSRVKIFYSVRVFDLFHSDRVILKIKNADRCRVRLREKELHAVGMMNISSDGSVLRATVDSNSYTSDEIQLISPSGNIFYDNFTLIIPGKIQRTFYGGFKAVLIDNHLVLLVQQRLDDLVTSTVASETSADDPEDYLKAMTIVSRTYILSQSDRHQEYDFCDNTHCQLFYGYDSVKENYIRMNRMTKGEVLCYRQNIAPFLYSAVCGGETMIPQRIWINEKYDSVFSSVLCNACASSQYYRWQRIISSNEFRKVFGYGVDAVKKIEIDSIDQFRPRLVQIFKRDGIATTLTVDEFRLKVGRRIEWNKILSNRFSLKIINNRLVIDGAGFGHGVGLCQEGARTLARSGSKYKEILQYYFPNTSVSKIQN